MAWLALPAMVTGQPVVKMGDRVGCSNEEVVIPVNIENFANVAALTLYISVDTSKMEYIGIENVNDVFSTGNFIGGVSEQNQILILNWMSLTPANLESGLMCNIRVLLKSDSVHFNFQDNCEIADAGLNVITNVEYINGSLAALSSFTLNPEEQSILEGDPALFELHDVPFGFLCQWQENIDNDWTDIVDVSPYQGAQTSSLSINSVAVDMNNNLYRCMLSNEACSVMSNPSLLMVVPNGISELETNENVLAMEVFPNPVNIQLVCRFKVEVHSGMLKLLSAQGVEVFHKRLENVALGEELSINTDSLPAGMYILQLLMDNNLISSVKVLRK